MGVSRATRRGHLQSRCAASLPLPPASPVCDASSVPGPTHPTSKDPCGRGQWGHVSDWIGHCVSWGHGRRRPAERGCSLHSHPATGGTERDGADVAGSRGTSQGLHPVGSDWHHTAPGGVSERGHMLLVPFFPTCRSPASPSLPSFMLQIRLVIFELYLSCTCRLEELLGDQSRLNAQALHDDGPCISVTSQLPSRQSLAILCHIWQALCQALLLRMPPV